MSKNMELPNHLQNILRRQQFRCVRRKGRFVGGPGFALNRGGGRMVQYWTIDWTQRKDDRDASKGFLATETGMNVMSINPQAIGGSGDGYLIVLEDNQSKYAVALGLWCAETNAASFEQDYYQLASISQNLSGNLTSFKSKSEGTRNTLFVIGAVTAICGIGIPILIGVLIWNGIAKKQEGTINGKAPMSHEATQQFIGEVAAYVRDSGCLMRDWFEEEHGISGGDGRLP